MAEREGGRKWTQDYPGSRQSNLKSMIGQSIGQSNGARRTHAEIVDAELRF